LTVLALDFGDRGENDMKEKTMSTDAPQSVAESIIAGDKIVDFLPSPDQLVRKTPKVKITITLNSKSMEFFKKSAKKNKVKYQTMSNEVLDQSARRYGDNA